MGELRATNHGPLWFYRYFGFHFKDMSVQDATRWGNGFDMRLDRTGIDRVRKFCKIGRNHFRGMQKHMAQIKPSIKQTFDEHKRADPKETFPEKALMWRQKDDQSTEDWEAKKRRARLSKFIVLPSAASDPSAVSCCA